MLTYIHQIKFTIGEEFRMNEQQRKEQSQIKQIDTPGRKSAMDIQLIKNIQ